LGGKKQDPETEGGKKKRVKREKECSTMIGHLPEKEKKKQKGGRKLPSTTKECLLKSTSFRYRVNGHGKKLQKNKRTVAEKESEHARAVHRSGGGGEGKLELSNR